MLPTLSETFSFLRVTFEKRFFQSETANGYGFCQSPCRVFVNYCQKEVEATSHFKAVEVEDNTPKSEVENLRFIAIRGS